MLYFCENHWFPDGVGALRILEYCCLQGFVRVLRFLGSPECGKYLMGSEESWFLQGVVRVSVISRASRMYGRPYGIVGDAVSARFYKGFVDPRTSRM